MLLALDDEKKLTPEKPWHDFSFKGTEAHKIQNLKKRKLIVSADPALTTMVSLPIGFRRDKENVNQPLALVELETLLTQEISKVFNRERREASSRLGHDELHTILVNAQALNFKIDGHLVLNPLGFPGKVVEAVLELTFTTREIFENLKDFFSAQEGFFFTEAARAGLRTLVKFREPPVSLIVMKSGGASAFILERSAWGHRISREEINWPFHSIFEAIASSLPVSHRVVLELYRLHLAGETSENFSRALGKIMKPETEKFLEKIKKSKLKGSAYIHSPVPLPLSLPHARSSVTLDDVPLEKVLEKSGFRLDASDWPFADSEIFMRLAPFFEFYYDKSDSEINHKLRRRIHWLIQ